MARNDANAGTGDRIDGVISRVTDKGFGFAQGPGGNEYFVHFSNCAPGVWDHICKTVGDGGKCPVSFNPVQTDKGLRAVAVQRK